jgi:hydroxysqualene synthase
VHYQELVQQATAKTAWTYDEAYEYCRRIALGHYENFPVGSIVVPRAQRRHFYSVYAFSRFADDFADEGDFSPAERLANLENWRALLAQTVNAVNAVNDAPTNTLTTSKIAPASNHPVALAHLPNHPVYIALAETIRQCQLPAQLFHDLIDAFVLDVKRSRHQTFADLLAYSRCSANPVGRLVLLLFNHREEHLHQLSDKICTALQLTNFWQDVLVDLAKDRIYLPQNEMATWNYSEDDLRAGRYNDSYIAMLNSLADRTQQMFNEGKPLCNLVAGRLNLELRLVWLGGTSLLHALQKAHFNVFAHRPTISNFQKITILLRALWPGKF